MQEEIHYDEDIMDGLLKLDPKLREQFLNMLPTESQQRNAPREEAAKLRRDTIKQKISEVEKSDLPTREKETQMMRLTREYQSSRMVGGHGETSQARKMKRDAALQKWNAMSAYFDDQAKVNTDIEA